VKKSGGTIFHYGWVKTPEKQQEKQKAFHALWHDDKWLDENVLQKDSFDYSSIDALKHFEGTHPKVMQNRIKNLNWKFNFDPTKRNISLKYKILQWIAAKTGWDIGRYKNYKLI